LVLLLFGPWGPLSVSLFNLIVLVPTDKCQGPLRGAFLDPAQDVCFLGPAGALLYSISMIALISLANHTPREPTEHRV